MNNNVWSLMKGIFMGGSKNSPGTVGYLKDVYWLAQAYLAIRDHLSKVERVKADGMFDEDTEVTEALGINWSILPF